MVIQRKDPLQKLDPGRAAALFFARTGIARLARRWRPSDVCVLTFHGVRDCQDDDQLLDLEQHVTVRIFDQVCGYLMANYAVLPLSEIVEARRRGKSLPRQTVAITFDDGYESNSRLAYPLLDKHGLPATIFAASGFLDGTVLWFHRLEAMLIKTRASRLEMELQGGRICLPLESLADREAALGKLTAHLKVLSNTSMLALLDQIQSELGVAAITNEDLPAALRPMSWDTARAMQAGGLIEFGGHTDSHPILARCSDEQQAWEIRRGRERLIEELGMAPKLFAYPNGKAGDYTAATKQLLQEEGFVGAFTMQDGFMLPEDEPMALPRYGYPSSRDYLEAVVSGSMARFWSLRKNLGLISGA